MRQNLMRQNLMDRKLKILEPINGKESSVRSWRRCWFGLAACVLQLNTASQFQRFIPAFLGLFALAVLSFVLAAQEVLESANLEYALWALLVGLLVANTIGTPKWLTPAVRGELFIKVGLVLLGAEVLFSRLLELGG